MSFFINLQLRFPGSITHSVI